MKHAREINIKIIPVREFDILHPLAKAMTECSDAIEEYMSEDSDENCINLAESMASVEMGLEAWKSFVALWNKQFDEESEESEG